jgi:hypothetical protein
MSAAIPVISSVPTIECSEPCVVVTTSVVGSKCDPVLCEMKVQLSEPMPRTITVPSVETKGMKASRKATMTMPRTTRSVARRRFSTMLAKTPTAIR